MKNKKILLSTILISTLPLTVFSCSKEVPKEQKAETEEKQKNEFYNLNLENIADLKNNWKIDFIQLNNEQNREIFANNESKIIFFEKPYQEVTELSKTQNSEEKINVTSNKRDYTFINKNQNIGSEIKTTDLGLEIKLLNKDYLKNKINLKFKENQNLLLVNFYSTAISRLIDGHPKDLHDPFNKNITTDIVKPIVDFSEYQKLVSSKIKFNSLNFDKNQNKINLTIDIDENQTENEKMINLLNQNYFFNIKTISAIKKEKKDFYINAEEPVYEPYGVSKKYILNNWILVRLLQYSFIIPVNISEKEYNSINDINLTLNDNAGVFKHLVQESKILEN
ncbi:hypothetical protein ACR34G_03960 [Mycoplasma sp. 480]|uniref:hypothetical protein n=1 Tax=Mycoplasma sp. 480 TaxID=3440155 RepID=UPI003F50E988